MKNKEIFDLLNDVSTDYEDVELDQEKISRIKKSFNLEKKNYGRRFTKVAAVFLIFISLLAFSNENVKAQMNNFIESFFTDKRVELSQASDLPEDIEKYTVSLHESVSLDNFSFIIEDVAIDGKYGYLNLIYPEKYSSRYNEENDFVYIIDKIYINGVKYPLISDSNHEEKIEDGLISSVKEFKLDKAMPEAGKIKLGIEFSEFSNPEDRALVELSISMEELSKDTKTYLENFSIPGAEEYKISKMIVNLFKPRIESIEPDSKNFYERSRFVGIDQAGRKLIFEHDNSSSKDKLKTCEYIFIPKNDSSYEDRSDLSLEEFYKLKGKIEFQMYKDIYSTNIFGKLKRDKNGKLIRRTKKVGNSFEVNFK